ncbi:TetR/AcrR family transcriptional regulator [Mammaliicoccus stepanovicii]|uniref:TetR family transcriptional regulator n=1 Tax=Mammaliicoccus stepanovicii TaxID=643214 RepID=A0A239ZSB0_9STAP|nr:TetR/AcrR family transcriptional regulator [Mammaliicoccus stepanovicii]PNZ74328.1 TetR/AcrR family transcriptional regulator [Mammaliicoccus stepanovicii]GGI38793.1 TetR family transcriptional regulator [Mammaliicoccus stepanovicii]SNV73839.1 TetR family transcriptional regulator [Mammaliicoccus stepanovicii]
MNRSIIEIVNEQINKQAGISNKQQSVLLSATELFSMKGFNNTSTKDIASLAQVSEGTVYKHFKTKDELLHAGLLPLYKSVVAPEIVKEFTNELSQCKDLESFVDTFVDNRIEFIHKNKNLLKIILGEVMFNDNIQTLMYNLLQEMVAPAIESLIQNLKNNNQIDPEIRNHNAFQALATNTISVMLPVLLSHNYDVSKLNSDISATKYLLLKMLK